MKLLTNQELLKDAAQCFKEARKNIYEGAALLYQIDESKAWEEHYSSLSEYVEQECQISRGFASKLLTLWRFYVIERGVAQKNLHGIDYEKLYMAIKLPQASGPSENLLTIAREWNREDIRAELSTTDGKECEHGKTIRLCTNCGKRVEDAS